MKLVHKSLTALVAVVCMLDTVLPAQEVKEPPYAVSYNPAKGLKPVQRSLTDIFLQLAGSLEHHGSPVPYLRHIRAEERRIAPLFKAKTGKAMPNYRPAYMTDEYIDQMIANWELLSPKLRLNTLAQDAGMCARKAILGPSGNGTVLVDIFNYHQDAVVASMEGKGAAVGFEALRKWLYEELEFDKPLSEGTAISKAMAPQSEYTLAVIVGHEKALIETEKKEYAGYLRMAHFTKAQFGPLERFYEGPYDRLTEEGKEQMSRRVWDGISIQPENMRAAALKAAQDFRAQEADLFKKIEAVLEAEKAHTIEAAINSVFIDLGHMANTELELGILESALK